MRWLWRHLRRLAILIGALVVLLIGVHLVTMAREDPRGLAGPGAGVPVWVVDHGYHSGIIIELAPLRRAALALGRVQAGSAGRESGNTETGAAQRLRWLAAQYPHADWLELGWGDAAFYQSTPGIGDIDPWLAFRALAWPTDAVLQLVPGVGDPMVEFARSDILRIEVTDAGLTGLALRLAETVPDPAPDPAPDPGPQPLGPSLYGGGAFYRANLDYHLLRTCNHWVSWLLRGAGVPSSPVPGTFSATMMAELDWRLQGR